MGSCFGEPPFPLPLAGGDEDLYSPASCRTNTFDGTSDISPSFEKVEIHDIDKTIADSKFIAQHVRNKDSFENVSIKSVHSEIKLFQIKYSLKDDFQTKIITFKYCYATTFKLECRCCYVYI